MKTFIAITVCSLILAATALAEDAKPKPEDLYNIIYTGDKDGAKVGTESQCKLTITPKGERVLKKETPFKAMLSGSEGLEIPKTKYTAKDFVDPKTPHKTIQTTFKSTTAGAQVLKADVSFFLCTAEICQRYKDTAQCKIEAK